TVGNLYKIIKAGTVTVLDSNLKERTEFSADAAFNSRTRHNKPSNRIKLAEAKPFLDAVCHYVLENPKIRSIDEAVNVIAPTFNGVTVCTKTIYNYVHQELIDIKKMHCLEMVGRKQAKKRKYAKRHKGTSIDQCPKHIENREEFGHWEGDLIVGGRSGNSGALLTLLERKTRKEIIIKIKCKSAKQVFMAINKVEKLFGSTFKQVFKSITFDNGSEFSRYEDIQKHPKSTSTRTVVYFAHPYCSWERGSNENANKLIRRFFPKGTHFNLLTNDVIQNAVELINKKKRRILNFKSASELFNIELDKLAS
ncbi:MAG: IS30 family transposase, partial [Alphaproteobacteria bacterium]